MRAVEEFKMADGTIRKAMIRLGIPRRRPGNLDTYAPELRQTAINKRIYGRKTCSQIESELGIPAKYVGELVRKFKRRQREERLAS